ncbi:beta strand repeat-containing protein [Anatilimnocola floriformis]|uniref:beta strand repeat-containing protein n=1 Tax=Anatilimnocola floriformis TaxID=2948575 RepID=UPI0020C4EB68|nr:hypothetical protein [Anatilimnocola floriformis]
MHFSVQRWYQSLKQSLLGGKAASTVRAKRSLRGAARKSLRLESLEERSMMAITATDQGNTLVIDTNDNGNLTLSAFNGTLTLTSTDRTIDGNPITGGFSTAQYNMADFDSVFVNTGQTSNVVFDSVNIIGSAAFANQNVTAFGVTVDVTGGPLTVNGLTLSSQGLGITIDIDQTINSTGAVNFHPLSANVILRAPINAPGQTVSLASGVIQTNTFTVSQTSAGVITANSVYAEAGGGVSLNADNHVSQIAGKVFAYGGFFDPQAANPGDFSFKSVDDLTVGTVPTNFFPFTPVSGVTTTNGNVTLSSAATKTITVNQAVTANGTGKLLTLSADAFDLDASKAITGQSVLLQTVGAGVNLTLGGAGLTNSELDAVSATNLTVAASGTVTVSGAMALGDDVSQLITLRGASVNVANSIAGNSSTGTLRFETNSLALNGAMSQSVSAPAVEILATTDVAFNNSFNLGGMDFTANELAALDEATVGTLRVFTTGDISFTGVATNFANGFILKSNNVVALQANGTISTSSGGSVTASRLYAAADSVSLTGASNSIGTIAGSAASGSFEVTSSGDLAVGSVDVGGRGIGAAGITGPVVLLTGGNVSQTASGPITAISLGVDATAAIDLTTANNRVGTLALKNSSGDMSFKNNPGTTLTIGTAGGITGITSSVTTTNVTVQTNSSLSVTAPIQKIGGGQLNRLLLTNTGDLTQTAGGTIEAASLGISANGSIELDGATTMSRRLPLRRRPTLVCT